MRKRVKASFEFEGPVDCTIVQGKCQRCGRLLWVARTPGREFYSDDEPGVGGGTLKLKPHECGGFYWVHDGPGGAIPARDAPPADRN